MASTLIAPGPGSAHPLGNFSISHYAGIRLGQDDIELRYLIDMAEIPTFQEIQETGIVPEAGHASLRPYLARKAETLEEGLLLMLDGRRLQLQIASTDVIFPPGAGGLPTMKMGVLYRARLENPAAPGPTTLRYRDDNFPGRAGWKEIIAVGASGVSLLSSSVPDKDRSQRLADYPTDLLNSPPQDLEARIVFTRVSAPPLTGAETPGPASPGAGVERPRAAETARFVDPIRLRPNSQATPRDALTELVATKQLGFGVVVMVLAVSAVLGAFHALEPGHGKTVVAAYLVGSRGTAWHAVVLGLVVTASHTAGVYLLGGVTFYASQYVLPERLYPWLGVGSGLTIAGLGLFLFLRRYAGAPHLHRHGHHHHPHDADAEHDHHAAEHGPHDHHHRASAAGHRHPEAGAAVSVRELVALGVTGGIIPCPAALVVLLSALSLRRVGFGLLLIVAFSVGLAVVLVAIGILMVYARRLMSRFHEDGPLITRWLPLASSAVITLLGVAIAVQALVSAGILQM
ncbi:MAG: hypothetical protein AUH29_01955 [Candidatus Rokubacteria bacterium 13_1_40CM_69_27]|nr:MAG: hypothetical protein AUH29_01955 [Candidatus Rokubacteria bacterium 13_1_40CM_69_27]